MKLKIALIGTGDIAGHHVRLHADPEAVLFPDGEAEFVAVMDLDQARAQAFASKYAIPRVYADADELLAKEKPHIVCVTTPPKSHAALSIKAMEAGAWVLCEKPLCSSLRELDAIQAVEARTGTYCSSVLQFRFGTGPQHIKRMAEEQVAGRLLVGTCHTTWYRDPAYYQVAWRGTWSSELGGATMSQGIHAMDTLLWAMGDWSEVIALCASSDRDVEVETISSASVRFESGAIGNILNSTLCPHENTFLRFDFQQATAWTENALYDLNNDKWRFKTLSTLAEEKAQVFRSIKGDSITKQPSQLKALIADYRAGRRPLASGPEARRTLEFITSLYKSAATGQAVARGSIAEGDPFYEHVAGTFAL